MGAPHRVPQSLERCGVEFMKRHTPKFAPRLHQTEGDLSTFIRKAKPGLWGEELPAADREKLEEQMRSLARKLGAGSDFGEDPVEYLLRGGGDAPPSER